MAMLSIYVQHVLSLDNAVELILVYEFEQLCQILPNPIEKIVRESADKMS